MFTLRIHADAQQDLRTIRAVWPEAWARIIAFLQDVKGSQDRLDRLTQHGYGRVGEDEFNVKRWEEQTWQHGRNLWRLRLAAIDELGLPYRIIYAFLPSEHEYVVLGVVDREFNYAHQHPISQRIIQAYNGL